MTNPSTLNTALSTQEKIRYGFCLDQIKHGLDLVESGWREIAAALSVIRDQRLYREEFGTFKEFCDKKINLTRGRVDQLIAAVKTITNIEETTTRVVIFPQTEKQVRPLAALPAAEQSAAWEEAVELAGGQQPTAATVKQVVDQRKAEAETPPLHDFQEGDFVKVRGIGQPGLVVDTNHSTVKVEIPKGDGVEQVWVTASVGVERCEAPIDGELIDHEWQEGDLVRGTNQHGVEVTSRIKSLGRTLAGLEDGSRIRLETATLLESAPEQEEDEEPEQALTDEELKQEMHTPDAVIEMAKWVMECDKFDLDPCSNSHEHPNLPAIRKFTRADDGLSRRWIAINMLFNPPYSPNGTIKPWIQKWLSAYESGDLKESIGLFPHYTAESWFSLFNPYLVGGIAGRLQYKNTDGKARFSSCLVYLGNKPGRFVEGATELCSGNIRRLVLPGDFEE
jgi:hypothetical protein